VQIETNKKSKTRKRDHENKFKYVACSKKVLETS
jgi:hypothetical protein